LQTDRIDLVQHHEVIRFDDPHRIFHAEGANAALLEARKAGKIRYIGFTGHKDPRIHLHTLEVATEHGFSFDTVQMPLNVMDAHYRSFEKLVLACPPQFSSRSRRARSSIQPPSIRIGSAMSHSRCGS
jgi:aryl-alcohol dehydrogenase-like predicted oxidoreductase